MGATEGEPLIMELYKEVLKRGAHPTIMPFFSHAKEHFFRYADKDQISHENYIIKELYSRSDRIIQVISESNTKQVSNVDPEKITMQQAANKEISRIFQEREGAGELDWSLMAYPCDALAQEASMGLEEFRDFVYAACYLDKEDPVAEWKKVSEVQERICKYLNGKEVFRFVGLDTDITLSCRGRTWINCDGKKNMPDGEVFTGPVEDSVEGTIRFTYPLIYLGNEIEDITLTFEGGVVVDSHAKKGGDVLDKILDIEGARRVGEIAIGTNYGITRFTKNILFDEKIGGTMHLAIGRSIPESGGKNVSVVHMDILKDMRDGGKVYADGELFYENGKFLI